MYVLRVLDQLIAKELLGVDRTKVVLQRLPGDLADGSGKFYVRGACADDDESSAFVIVHARSVISTVRSVFIFARAFLLKGRSIVIVWDMAPASVS